MQSQLSFLLNNIGMRVSQISDIFIVVTLRETFGGAHKIFLDNIHNS